MATQFSPFTLLVGAGTLVLGLVLGGLGPRSQVRSLRAELDAQANCEVSLGPLGPLLRGDITRPQPPPAERVASDSPTTVAPDPADGGQPPVMVVEADTPEDNGFDREQTREAVEDALALRARQARQALSEHVDDEQLIQIDTAVGRMNEDLSALAGDFVDEMNSGAPQRRDLMVYAAETLDVMIRAEDAIYDTMDPEQLDSVDEAALDPFSYIDPSVVELVEALDR